MTELISNVPPRSAYKKKSDKVFFSYPENQTHFQTDYYGVAPNVFIAGTLHLRFPPSNPLLATKIELIFKGYEKVRWTESRGERTVTYRAKEIFANQLFQLWTTSKDGDYEEIKCMDLPFEIKLPENLPPSIRINKGEGKVIYKLIANIGRKGNLWKFKGPEKSIKLLIDLDTFIPPPINLQPFNWNQLNDSEAISRGLGYNITLNNSIGSPNVPFVINSHLKFYDQGFRINKIFFGVKERHKLITKRKSKKSSFYLVEKNIKGEEIQLDSNGEVTLQVRLEIPQWDKKNKKNFCWTLEDRKHVIVNHKVKIQIYCGGLFTRNIKLENEVQIKNILG